MKGWKARPLIVLSVVIALVLAISLPATAVHLDPVQFPAGGPVQFPPGGPADVSSGSGTSPNRCTEPYALTTEGLYYCGNVPPILGQPDDSSDPWGEQGWDPWAEEGSGEECVDNLPEEFNGLAGYC